MLLELIKKIKWQLYITREVNFTSEHLMHEGWISFTKEIFGLPVLKRINLYENGVASIFVSEEDIKKYTEYIKDIYKQGKLKSLYLKMLESCKNMQFYLEKLKNINYKSKSDLQIFAIFNDLHKQSSLLGPALILPRLIDLSLTSINSWRKNKNIVSLLKDFSNLNELRREIASEKLTKEWTLLFREIGMRRQFSEKEMSFLFPNEVETLLIKNNKKTRNNIKNIAKRRAVKCLYVTIDGKTKSYEDGYEDLQNILFGQKNILEEKKITGRNACNGNVYGKAIIVLKNEDYRKVKRGNILVTSMTQPDIGRVLDKIVGIITDEGGILAHASILAREQNIPCLIATKIATTIIKDGDYIQLNASSGYFEILPEQPMVLKQISYESTAWNVKKKAVKKQKLKLNIYEANNSKKLIIWLPGMSDCPYADNKNPLLQYFVSNALKNYYSVVVVAFPGTAECGYIEERTMKTMKQNVEDSLKALYINYPKYREIEKILIGRSAGGTLAGSLIDQGFTKCILIAGRLKAKKLAEQYTFKDKKLIPFGKIKSFIQTRDIYLNNNKNRMYFQNNQYIKELFDEELNIRKIFKKTSELKYFEGILAIQALDDKVIPFELKEWKLLANKFALPISLLPIKYTCGHSFSTQPAISEVTRKILKFIN